LFGQSLLHYNLPKHINNFSFYIKDNPDVIARLEKISTRSGMITTIITGINYDMPNCLSHLIPEIAFPHPSKEELSDLVDQFAQVLGPDIQAKNKDIPDFRKYTAKHKEDIIGSVSGLTRSQAASALKTSLVKHKKWDIQTILSEKRDSVHKAGLLEFVNLKFTVDDIGGLSTLVNWLKARKDIFSDSAREYGLPVPKGLLLLGAPGCGKSLTCKAIASLWGMPLLRLDFGKMFHSLVGQSEGNIRQAINLAEHNSPVILWIDEIEKALTGIQSSGKSDGGTTSRVLSTFLTWMQEKTAPVFVVATANAQDQIPTEFMRAGRFDEVFFVKLPSVFERKEITRVLLRRKGWEGNKFNIDDIVANTNGYSGAEIEKAIDNGMLLSFSDKKRDLATKDILKALDNFTPLSRIREDDFIQMEETAKKCLIANTPDPENSISIDNKEKGVVDKADSPKITLD